MTNLTTILFLTLTLFLGSIGNSESADFQKGLTAANSGDFTTAVREWTPLAEQGNANAQYNLGIMYDKGRSVIQNYKTAMKWYRRAGKQGNASAQYALGLIYDSGQVVPQDYKTAVKWYRLSAKQGYALAQNNLSILQKRMAKSHQNL